MTDTNTTPFHHDYETLGALTWLAMNSQTHHRLPSGEFMRQLKPAMQQQRVHLMARNGQPLAWLAWRHLSENNATDAWLDFWVRPYGCDDKLAQTVVQTLRHAWGLQYAQAPTAFTLSWYDPSTDQLHRNITPEQLIGR